MDSEIEVSNFWKVYVRIISHFSDQKQIYFLKLPIGSYVLEKIYVPKELYRIFKLCHCIFNFFLLAVI